MNTGSKPTTLRGLSVAAVIFGVLGGAFFWWVPMGMVLSIGGAMLGFVDWTVVCRHSLDYRLSVVAIFLSLAAFCLDMAIASLGLQFVTFMQP